MHLKTLSAKRQPFCSDRKLICQWVTWWRHQMETFTALLAICAGNSSVLGEFPTQRPVTRSFDVFFDLRLNKQLSKQWWGWWFETLSHPLWRHHNVNSRISTTIDRQLIMNIKKSIYTTKVKSFTYKKFVSIPKISGACSAKLLQAQYW